MTDQGVLIPEHEFSWSEIAAALFAARGISSGLWRVGTKVNFTALTADWSPAGVNESVPTAMVGVSGIVLFPSAEPGPMVFDAAGGGTKVAALKRRRGQGQEAGPDTQSPG